MRKFYNIDPHIHYEDVDDIIKEPEIIRVYDFDEDDLEEFEEAIDRAHQTKQPVIPIVIDTYGGCTYGLLGMISAIQNCRLPVATILSSKAMSAGSMLFCFGTENYRFMHPDAQMMIHDAGSCSDGKVEEIKITARHLDQINNMVYKKASKQIGQPSNYLGDLVKQNNHLDWFLTAKDAKKHNIANHLRIPSFEVEISLNIKLV
jgi:ATP-dependent Clp protease protease subunit